MDNGAYEAYRAQNPVVNTPVSTYDYLLSTYDYLRFFVHEITLAETILIIVALGLSAFALASLFKKRRRTPEDET